MEWPIPHNVKTLRSFLGFTGYYRRYVKDYAKLVKPLNDLLVGHPTNLKALSSEEKKKKKKKGTPWQWGEAQQCAFDVLKQKLSSPPILAYADFNKPFILHTDASGEGLGAVLYQEQDGVERVIAYASRGLRNSERHYPAHKLEFLCLKWAVTDKFHDYLYGNQFLVCTDNNPLTYVLSTAKLDATGHRWLAALSSYNFSLKYKTGKSNSDADGLSRKPHETQELFTEAVKAICQAYTVARGSCPYAENLVITSSPQLVESLDSQSDDSLEFTPKNNISATDISSINWAKEQSEDSCIGKIFNFVKSGYYPTKEELDSISSDGVKLLRHWKNLFISDGILYRKTSLNGEEVSQLVLPLKYCDMVFTHLHENVGHQGQDRTLSLVKSRFFWPGFETDIINRVKNCERCIKRKTYPKPSAELVNIVSTQPMELVCIDFLSLEQSKGGFENVLVITDHFTRYAQAFPTRNQLAKTTAKVLFENFIVHYGFPARLHSDQGRNFESSVIKELCALAGVQKTRTTPYHPMGNGMVERFNQTLLNMLGTLEDRQKDDWRSFVAPLVHSYNATKHESTGYSPYFLMFGRHPRLAVDAYLGLNSPDSPSFSSKEHYATKLKKRLEFAYKIASREAEKSAEQYKTRYDSKVREATVNVGDRVLIRKVGLKGRNKLADKWNKDPYVIVSQPDPNIPVFQVKKESDNTTKVLHRNMLLPFSVIPSVSEVSDSLLSSKKDVPQGRKGGKGKGKKPDTLSESEESSDSDTDTNILVPDKYVIPQKRKSNRHTSVTNTAGYSNQASGTGSTVTPNLGDSHYSRELLNESYVPYGSTAVDQNGHSVQPTSFYPSRHVSTTVSLDQSPTLSPEISFIPRRTGRTRKPPDRYGEWVSNPVIAEPDTTQIWYV